VHHLLCATPKISQSLGAKFIALRETLQLSLLKKKNIGIGILNQNVQKNINANFCRVNILYFSATKASNFLHAKRAALITHLFRSFYTTSDLLQEFNDKST
jgi:hypothetical protein